MVRGIIIFLMLFGALSLLFSTWRSWTPEGTWSVAKALGLAGISAAAAILIIAVIVAAF